MLFRRMAKKRSKGWGDVLVHQLIEDGKVKIEDTAPGVRFAVRTLKQRSPGGPALEIPSRDLFPSPKIELRLTVLGPPRTKKNSSRVFPGAKFPIVLPSKQYCVWEKAAKKQVPAQFSGPAIARPVNVRAIIFRERRTGDLVNYMQAVADMLQSAGVLIDDKWVTGWDGSRLAKDAANPRVEIEITSMSEDPE